MADAPWRCSQCGTVNEPNANSCRSCGRWPSLFDLERGTLEEKSAAAEEAYRHDAPMPEEIELPVEPVETDYSGVPDQPGSPERKEWRGPGDPLDQHPVGWPVRLASWIVPLVFVIYVLISIIANR